MLFQIEVILVIYTVIASRVLFVPNEHMATSAVSESYHGAVGKEGFVRRIRVASEEPRSCSLSFVCNGE